MHPNCVLEIAAAIGRTPTAREIDEFEGGILRNMPDFAKAFDVKAGDKMYLPQDQAVRIW